jgi:hypothetical protein
MSSEPTPKWDEAGTVRGLTDAEVSARSTRRAAWVAAAAALLAAMLALAGTLWSGYTSSRASDRAAMTAADAAVKAVSVQLSGETERSRAEFLRNQQRIAYFRVVKDMREMLDIESKLRFRLPPEAYPRIQDDMNRVGAKVYDDSFELQMLGSEDVRDSFNNFLAAGIQFTECANKAIDINGEQERERYIKSCDKYSDKQYDQQKEFVRAARHDMGNK